MDPGKRPSEPPSPLRAGPHAGRATATGATAIARTAPDWKARARRAGEHLGRRVLGQGEAVEAVARAVRRAAAGLASGRGPLATLLFVGPTGSGKTELARALAEELGGPRRLVRIDCSEFAARHETSKLLGAPPGYVGHEHGGALARRLPADGAFVLLLDEIEKADAALHELLLQVLDEGRLTDGRGATLDFRRAFVVLTSNAGTRELAAARAPLGFTPEPPGHRAERAILERALGRVFAPEFLGRLDEIVPFRALAPDALREVAGRALLDLALRVRRSSRRVRFSSAVARWAAGDANGPAGARGVLHRIRREIEAPLAEALLAAGEDEWIEVSIRRGRPHFAHGA